MELGEIRERNLGQRSSELLITDEWMTDGKNGQNERQIALTNSWTEGQADWTDELMDGWKDENAGKEGGF